MKELVMYRNPVVESKVREFLEERVEYSTLSVKDKERVLVKLESGCKSCDLHYSGYSNIPSKINSDCKFLFIGRNPNKGEAQKNELLPLSTIQGNTFNKYLEFLGIGPSEYSLINMCNCYSKGGRPVTQEEINKCITFRHLEVELMSKLRIIFPMGQDALKWIFGLNHPGVMQCVGEVYSTQLYGRDLLIIPIYHPSHIVLERELAGEMEVYLKRLRKLIEEVR